VLRAVDGEAVDVGGAREEAAFEVALVDADRAKARDEAVAPRQVRRVRDAAEAVPEGRDVVDGGDHARERLEVRRARLPLGHVAVLRPGKAVVRRLELVRAQGLEERSPPVEGARVGAEELVRARDEEVAVERSDVHESVRRVVDRVHDRRRADALRGGDGGADVVDRPERVGRVPDLC